MFTSTVIISLLLCCAGIILIKRQKSKRNRYFLTITKVISVTIQGEFKLQGFKHSLKLNKELDCVFVGYCKLKADNISDYCLIVFNDWTREFAFYEPVTQSQLGKVSALLDSVEDGRFLIIDQQKAVKQGGRK